jgi:hypothetical protein
MRLLGVLTTDAPPEEITPAIVGRSQNSSEQSESSLDALRRYWGQAINARCREATSLK